MQIIHAKQALTERGWRADVEICVGNDGRISTVGSRQNAPDHAIDLALPAPANLHSHTFQRAMAGLTEKRGPSGQDSFWSWRTLMYQFLNQLTPDDVQSIATLAFMEMMEAGYSAVAEFHYLHHAPGGAPYGRLSEMSDRIIEAAESVGIALTHLPVLYRFGGCDQRPLQGGQTRFGNTIDQFETLWHEAAKRIAEAPPDFSIGVAPHSLRAVDARALNAAIRLSGGRPVHMHIAEQRAEVDEVLAHTGLRPIEWLLANHDVDPRWCLIHCTQMTQEETAALAKTGAVAGLCPITESSLGDGTFAGVLYTNQGGRVGVGSDSNIDIAFFAELCTLEYSQRLRDHTRVALASETRSCGRYLVDSAVTGGHQAAGRDAGCLREGMLADILGVSTDNRWVCGRQGDVVLDCLVFSGHGRDCITDVWSAGRHQVQNSRHVAHERIVDDYRRTMAKLAG